MAKVACQKIALVMYNVFIPSPLWLRCPMSRVFLNRVLSKSFCYHISPFIITIRLKLRKAQCLNYLKIIFIVTLLRSFLALAGQHLKLGKGCDPFQ